MMKATLQTAYLLHRRPYRETSYLLEVFTKNYGRITLIARGGRKKASAPLLQPFSLLLLSWVGKGELKTLTGVEPGGNMLTLKGHGLFSGFYLNELLMRLLQKWDPHPVLFEKYEDCLVALKNETFEEKNLRIFELRLLEEMGYGLMPKSLNQQRANFKADQFYCFIPEHGFITCDPVSNPSSLFSGEHLLAIAAENWEDKVILRQAKRLLRLVLNKLMDNKPIYSRTLFLEL